MKKNVLIIGGTSDIGFAIAKEFAQLGFDITLVGRDYRKGSKAIASRFQGSVLGLILVIIII